MNRTRLARTRIKSPTLLRLSTSTFRLGKLPDKENGTSVRTNTERCWAEKWPTCVIELKAKGKNVGRTAKGNGIAKSSRQAKSVWWFPLYRRESAAQFRTGTARAWYDGQAAIHAAIPSRVTVSATNYAEYSLWSAVKLLTQIRRFCAKPNHRICKHLRIQ